jgi:hypothetical protein
VVNLRAPYESIRQISFEVLELFPSDLAFLTPEKISYILEGSLKMISNPINRQYESGALIINLVAENYTGILLKANHPFIHSEASFEKPSPIDLNIIFLKSLTKLVKTKFTIFEESFLTHWVDFNSNMPHGLITTLCNVLDSTFNNDFILKHLSQSQADRSR